jgi:hypothetical protein
MRNDYFKQINLLYGQSTNQLHFCEHCMLGKQKWVSFDDAIHMNKGYFNLWDFSRVTFYCDVRCVLTFIDDYYIKIWINFFEVQIWRV